MRPNDDGLWFKVLIGVVETLYQPHGINDDDRHIPTNVLLYAFVDAPYVVF